MPTMCRRRRERVVERLSITGTGNTLGSGTIDIWTYVALEKALTARTTVRPNAGYLFVGNTSTGVVGVTATTHGHIATMRGSLVRVISDKLQLGGETAGAATKNGRSESRAASVRRLWQLTAPPESHLGYWSHRRTLCCKPTRLRDAFACLSVCHPPSADGEEPAHTQERSQNDHGPF